MNISTTTRQPVSNRRHQYVTEHRILSMILAGVGLSLSLPGTRADVPAALHCGACVDQVCAEREIAEMHAKWLVKKKAEEKWYSVMMAKKGFGFITRMGVRPALIPEIPDFPGAAATGSAAGIDVPPEFLSRVVGRALRTRFQKDPRAVESPDVDLADLLAQEELERIVLDQYYVRTTAITDLGDEQLVMEYSPPTPQDRESSIVELVGSYSLGPVPYHMTVGANGADDDCDMQQGQIVISNGGGGGGYHIDSFFDVFTELSTVGIGPGGENVTVSQMQLEKIAGSCDGLDDDCDGVIEEQDWIAFQPCYTGHDDGPISPYCLAADMDEDNDVDGGDWQAAKAKMAEAGLTEKKVLPPGFDLFMVKAGTAWIEFGGNSMIPPIPAGFFGPGSDPFEGQVALMAGRKIRESPTGIRESPTRAAMVWKKKAWADLTTGSDTVEAELKELNLMSKEPIRIENIDSFFDVFVTVTDNNVPAKTAMMPIRESPTRTYSIRESPTGGIGLMVLFQQTWPLPMGGVADAASPMLIKWYPPNPVVMEMAGEGHWTEKETKEEKYVPHPEPEQDFYVLPMEEVAFMFDGGLSGGMTLTGLQATEACCLRDARCVDVTVSDCATLKGDPQGPGTDCDSVPAPVCNLLKWAQPPVPAPASNIFHGWDYYSVWDQQSDGPSNLVADDWLCTTPDPVSDIHWWGSYVAWKQTIPPSQDAPPVDPPVNHFHILIWTDVPADPLYPTSFSHPGEVIWESYKMYADTQEQFVGWDRNPDTGEYEATFRYEVDLPASEWFYQGPTPEPTIYWVTIAACYDPNPIFPMAYPWGWKTRPRDPNSLAPDASVVIYNPWWATLGSIYSVGEPIICCPAGQWDMAFELTTKKPVSVPKWGEAPKPDDPRVWYYSAEPALGPPPPPQPAADDFECLSPDPIQRVEWWGAQALGTGGIFRIRFYTNVPAGVDAPYSHPGTQLYQVDVANWTQVLDAAANAWRFTADLATPFSQEPGSIYWFSTAYVHPTNGWNWLQSTQQWNDFAVQRIGGLWVEPLEYNLDLAFRLSVESLTDELKWSQPPQAATDQCFRGWDEMSWYDGPQIVADDWPCTSNLPITDVHWWGSYLNWAEGAPPANAPDSFQIAIWTDVPRPQNCCYCWNDLVPASTCFEGLFDSLTCTQTPGWDHCAFTPNAICGVNGTCEAAPPFSHPGTVIATFVVPRGMLNERVVGCDTLEAGVAPETCFKYDYSPDVVLFSQPAATCSIYWISISAMYASSPGIDHLWGWKTREHMFMDDAVRIFLPTAPASGSPFEFGEPIQNPVGTSWDMAFVLTSPEAPEACCLVFEPQPACQDVPPSQCMGNRQGPGTTCSPVLEACCFANGSCMMVDPICCDDLGGVPQGPFSQCTQPEGCCLPDGTCLMVDPICCDDLGGTPMGLGSQCTTLEACCMAGGACRDLDPLCCDQLGGAPQGAGTGCVDTLRACCLPAGDDPDCVNVDPVCCDDVGGEPSPIGAAACMGDQNGNGTDDACEIPKEACCLQNGTCVEVEYNKCVDLGGDPQGPDTICDMRYCSALKWVQPPTYNVAAPGGQCFWGWDDLSDYFAGPIVADDWACSTNQPITDIHWWGSYQNWTTREAPPPGMGPVQFHIGIWTDVPAAQPSGETCCYCYNPPGTPPPTTCSPNPPDQPTCDLWGGGQYQQCTYFANSRCMGDQCVTIQPLPYSHPGKMIWQWTVQRETLNERWVGCDQYPGMPPDTCFRYDFTIPQAEWFYQAPSTDPTIYWISISAVNLGPQQQYPWGWKTREHFFNDDAVRIFAPMAPTPGAEFLDGFPIETPDGVSWDMAFALTTVSPGPSKWDQWPNPDLPGLHAHDGITVADNWECQGGLVTDFHWWGNYELDAQGNERRGAGIQCINISIHKNQPDMPWCVPQDPELWGVCAFFDPLNERFTGLYNSEGSRIYQYDFYLEPGFEQVQGEIYWLNLEAFPVNAANPALWRWQENSRGTAPRLCPATERTPSQAWHTIEWGPPPFRYSEMAFRVTSTPYPPGPDPSATAGKNRYLSMVVPPAPTPPEPLTALQVTLIDLQHPIPANLPQYPPRDFTTFDTMVNGVCVGGSYPGHHCDTDADCRLCVGGSNAGRGCTVTADCPGGSCPAEGTCSSLAACTAAGELNGCARWVGKPGTFLENQDAPGGATNRSARLQCTPYYHDWGSEGVFHVTGAEIVPSSKYEVVSFAWSCMGNENTCAAVSPPLPLTTARSGDVEAPFNPPSTSTQPNAIDVAQVVNKLKNLVGAPVKAIAQLQPNLPELNANVNALDIVAVVDAVKQKAYAFSGPCACPSAVTCGSTACANSTICATTYGVGSMCVKTCNGGTNAGDPCINNSHCPGGGVCGNAGANPGYCRDRCGRCTP